MEARGLQGDVRPQDGMTRGVVGWRWNWETRRRVRERTSRAPTRQEGPGKQEDIEDRIYDFGVA